MKIFSGFLIVLLSFYTHISFSQEADSLLNFIRSNPKNASFYLIRNDTVVTAQNENKMMPLAGTMDMLVAIEFAKQAAFNVFDTSQMIALSELNKYYIPLTDEGAHEKWLNDERRQGNIRTDSIPILHVARGMTIFGSNANTEYLMDKLGLQNINNNYGLMGIEAFTPLDYPVASLFIYQNPQQRKENKILREIKDFSDHNYSVAAYMLHQQLKNNPEYKATFRPRDFTPDFQKEWNRRQPAATAKAYAQIAQILNNRSIFNEKTYAILSRILESTITNQQLLVHAGKIDGITVFGLTRTAYAESANGDKVAFSCFFNNLTEKEIQKIQNWMSDFTLQALTK